MFCAGAARSCSASSRPAIVHNPGMSPSCGLVPSAARVVDRDAVAAGPWVTDFLNAAYYARPVAERAAATSASRTAILATRGTPRRAAGARDARPAAFHRAFGAIASPTAAASTATRCSRAAPSCSGTGAPAPSATTGGARPRIAAPVRRRGASAYEPESRATGGGLGALTAPAAPLADHARERHEPVPLADRGAALRFLADPGRWPDMGSDRGRFTALRAAAPARADVRDRAETSGRLDRLPMYSRAYVTCTACHEAGAAPGRPGRGAHRPAPALADAARPSRASSSRTHARHPLGAAISRLLITRGGGGARSATSASRDPLPWHLQQRVRARRADGAGGVLGARAGQASMLAQLALVTEGRDP